MALMLLSFVEPDNGTHASLLYGEVSLRLFTVLQHSFQGGTHGEMVVARHIESQNGIAAWFEIVECCSNELNNLGVADIMNKILNLKSLPTRNVR